MLTSPPKESALINVHDLYLNFPIYHGEARSLKKTLFSKARKSLPMASLQKAGGELTVHKERKGSHVLVQALNNISFTITPGERVGLVGHNGAGKSSLLRALAGIYEPASGTIQTKGSINALLDPAGGMNLQLSGRENIQLTAQQLKMNASQRLKLEKDVEEFADLGAFLDLPMRLYSSGMIMRIGFGLATATLPQILLMDEWFMAGDSAFQLKAQRRLEHLIDGADILVLTSHAIKILHQWCTRILWLEKGKILKDGAPSVVLDDYLRANGSSLEEELAS